MRRLGATATLLALLAGCTSSGLPTSHTSHSSSGVAAQSPLPTKGSSVDLLCGFVPKQGVVTALGRGDFTVSGELSKSAEPNPDGTMVKSASCTVEIPHGGDAAAFSVAVERFTERSGSGILRTARTPGQLLGNTKYPTDVGIGFAGVDTYTDGLGHVHNSCNSGLVRGDWVVTLGILVPGPGRQPVQDTMALAEEIVNELKLPLNPTKPYPNPI